jgi:hypothetical protein
MSIFDQMKEHTPDEYWIDIFEKCKNGELINVKFDEDNKALSIKPPNAVKYEIINLSSDPAYAAQVCISSFQETLGLYSEMDMIPSQELQSDREDIRAFNDWKSYRPKTLKERAICDFCERNTSTKSDMKKLTDLVLMYISLKKLNNDNIIVKEGIITELKGCKIVKDENSNEMNITFESDSSTQAKSVAAKAKTTQMLTQAIIRHSKLHKQKRQN